MPKINNQRKNIFFLYTNFFFVYFEIIPTQNRKAKLIYMKPHCKVTKLLNTIFTLSGLAQPDPEALLLGLAKSIYCNKARLNFQLCALCEYGSRVGQKISTMGILLWKVCNCRRYGICVIV